MGEPTKVQDAVLAQYLERLVRAFTIGRFAERGLAEDEILRAYTATLPHSYYYPHEHLDFPPWPYENVLGDRRVYAGTGMLESLATTSQAEAMARLQPKSMSRLHESTHTRSG